MSQRNKILTEIIQNPNFKTICKKIGKSYADDLYQEICEEILTMPIQRLTGIRSLNLWYYRVALNIMCKWGKLGKIVFKEEHPIPIFTEQEILHEKKIKQAEKFMLELSEFENRIILLYLQHKNMKKVQKVTGISYSALRAVKEKIKSVRL